jgi:6-phosphofructokinase 2
VAAMFRHINEIDCVEYIVASGSLPEGVPDDIYGRLAGVAKKIKAKVIADTSGEPLRHLIKEGLFMINQILVN